MNQLNVPDWLKSVLGILTVTSFLPQSHAIWQRGGSSGISVYYLLLSDLCHRTICSQGVVFALVGVSWPVRLNFADPERSFIWWYIIFGCPAVDNFLFAGVQATRLCLVVHQRSRRTVVPEPESDR
ncbi:hypothetical protein BJX66DRAFT_336128 [Aspergillus keveii]|uniref:Uncharacterized protein n=1 Tax=Aspergillus keveii TaxID=714993 RepID=A0ABR4GBG2_9EURO